MLFTYLQNIIEGVYRDRDCRINRRIPQTRRFKIKVFLWEELFKNREEIINELNWVLTIKAIKKALTLITYSEIKRREDILIELLHHFPQKD